VVSSKRKATNDSRHAPRPKPPRTTRAAAAVRRAYDKVRALCLAREGVYEKEAWATPTFRVERGKMFLMFADNHHDDGRVAFWCMASPDSREAWLGMSPDRFFVPPYVGPSGWIGVRLEGDVPWDAVAEIVAEARDLAAPKARRK
jgi:predicted DNA-binding protein (MmcQ/YjbR family)